MEDSEDGHEQVEKIWHNSDVNKNRTSLQIWWEDKEKTAQEGCQEAYRNFKVAAAFSGKYWLLPPCDKYL